MLRYDDIDFAKRHNIISNEDAVSLTLKVIEEDTQHLRQLEVADNAEFQIRREYIQNILKPYLQGPPL